MSAPRAGAAGAMIRRSSAFIAPSSRPWQDARASSGGCEIHPCRGNSRTTMTTGLTCGVLPLGGGSLDDEQAEVRTFLIADVRGYTRFTQTRGDEAAAALAARFVAVVQQVVEARDGVLLELRGDEALVVFSSPRQAVRCAVELQARFVEETLD